MFSRMHDLQNKFESYNEEKNVLAEVGSLFLWFSQPV